MGAGDQAPLEQILVRLGVLRRCKMRMVRCGRADIPRKYPELNECEAHSACRGDHMRWKRNAWRLARLTRHRIVSLPSAW